MITLMALSILHPSSQALSNGAQPPFIFQSRKHNVDKPPPAAPSENFMQDFLDAHNRLRASVGVPPVTWNATVAAFAASYAAKRAAADCKLVHSGVAEYGENIAYGYGDDFVPVKACMKYWVEDERPYYDHSSNTCAAGKECRHYTQMLWRNTTSIGCAKAACRNGWTFISCNYYPPGNYVGERPY
ncbi:unnamed protein product [Cuscuta campestris]|uniref:SCP domain-containing protein n=1 Tax=Cuscuta campestris TaxID=132261 RepID=A0A484K3M8_9ASTE|nr:unnamed protein product [Cuscuta campestris]